MTISNDLISFREQRVGEPSPLLIPPFFGQTSQRKIMIEPMRHILCYVMWHHFLGHALASAAT